MLKEKFCVWTNVCRWCGLVLYLLSTVLLHAAVDVTEPSSRQHVWRLLVDESVKMSLDLKNVEQKIKIHRETVIWSTGTRG